MEGDCRKQLRPLERFLLSSSSHCMNVSCKSPVAVKSKKRKLQQQLLLEKEKVERRKSPKEVNTDLVGETKSLSATTSPSSIVSSSSKTTLIKGQWTAEEDSTLVRLVKQYGVRKWSHIAKMLVGRIGKQCRERWHNHLQPDIKKDGWSEEEERMLIEAHEKVGNKWAEIAKRIPGRTENSIKNHWNATKRRQQNSRRKAIKGKKVVAATQPHSSILQDYIAIVTKASNVTLETASDRTNSSVTTDTPPCSPIIQDQPFVTGFEPIHKYFLNHNNQIKNESMRQELEERTIINYHDFFNFDSNFTFEWPDQPTVGTTNAPIFNGQDEISCCPIAATSTQFLESDAYISHLLNGDHDAGPHMDMSHLMDPIPNSEVPHLRRFALVEIWI